MKNKSESETREEYPMQMGCEGRICMGYSYCQVCRTLNGTV
ncbi:MAG: hypothetical protein ACLTSO_01490 [Coprococcus sp.]